LKKSHCTHQIILIQNTEAMLNFRLFFQTGVMKLKQKPIH